MARRTSNGSQGPCHCPVGCEGVRVMGGGGGACVCVRACVWGGC